MQATDINPAKNPPVMVPNVGGTTTGFDALRARFAELPKNNKLAIAIGVPVLLAMCVALMLWGSATPYKTLFSNVSDKDGGEIVSALNQMGVPYKYSPNGTSILVPESNVYDARLALASQGLPKGEVTGFEMMDSQPLGVTQFQEQVNFQRGLEGELARSIMTLSAVESARVHLAMPKPSIFVRDEEKPSASVVVSLYRGRALSQQQVDGIVHLVSSSLPNLSPKAVSIVDQSGALLTQGAQDGISGLTSTQLNYQDRRERSYEAAIVGILSPLFGKENVKATVSADIDFSSTERTVENYTPNSNGPSAIRSEQQSSLKDGSGNNPNGIPGLLANTPPDGAKAQIGGNAQELNSPFAANNGTEVQSDSVRNYEVDKEVVYRKEQMGAVSRLTAGVVINYKTITNAEGVTRSVPLTPTELSEINSLVKQAVGFNEQRGDALNIVNQPFTEETQNEVPFWSRAENVDLAKTIGMPIAIALAVAFIVFGLLRPIVKPLMAKDPMDGPELLPNGSSQLPLIESTLGGDEEDELYYGANVDKSLMKMEREREGRLEMVRTLAAENPEVLAAVVKNWLAGIPMDQQPKSEGSA